MKRDLAMLGLLAILLAGCGGSSNPFTPDPEPVEDPAPEEEDPAGISFGTTGAMLVVLVLQTQHNLPTFWKLSKFGGTYG